MADLVLRPSTLSPEKPWCLQLRWHECCGPTEYLTVARVSDEVARDIIRAGAPTWLFGDPDKGRAAEQRPADSDTT